MASKPSLRSMMRSRGLGLSVKFPSLQPSSAVFINQVSNMTTQSTNLQYVETEFREYFTNNFLARQAASKIDVFNHEWHFPIVENITGVIGALLDKKYEYTVMSPSRRTVQFFVDGVGVINARTNSSSTFVSAIGDMELIAELGNHLLDKYEEIVTSVDWMVNTDGSTITVPLTAPKGITNSSYPFIEEGVDSFIDAFLESSENILLLFGQPGTGKSNFIKQIIARSKKNALVTYDPEVMQRDGLFATFIEGEYGTLVMEDADTFLGKRQDGNTTMSRMLNTGDGIVSMRGKKIVFSTNLPSVDDIDPALLRRGRCFAVVNFRAMTAPEAEQFLRDHNITDLLPTSGDTYTLADLYTRAAKNRDRITTPSRKAGFY